MTCCQQSSAVTDWQNGLIYTVQAWFIIFITDQSKWTVYISCKRIAWVPNKNHVFRKIMLRVSSQVLNMLKTFSCMERTSFWSSYFTKYCWMKKGIERIILWTFSEDLVILWGLTEFYKIHSFSLNFLEKKNPSRFILAKWL